MIRVAGQKRTFKIALKRSPDLGRLAKTGAIFDAKHIYDPANPFARDDKIAKAHSLNPAFVQFMQEEQKVEPDFFTKYFWYWMTPSFMFVLWYWNELQKDDRFTSKHSKPIQEWNIYKKFRRVYMGEHYENESGKEYREPTIAELNMMKKLDGKERRVTYFENENQGESYKEFMARKKEERAIEDRIQKVMEEAEQKREEELYLEEREKFGEQLKKEDEIRSDIRKSLNK